MTQVPEDDIVDVHEGVSERTVAVEPAVVVGQTEVGSRRIVAGGRTAPMLMVLYRCPKCAANVVLDAYQGVPSCRGAVLDGHPVEFMYGVNIVRGD